MISLNLQNGYTNNHLKPVVSDNTASVSPMLEPGGGGDEPEQMLAKSATVVSPINNADLGDLYSPSGAVKSSGITTTFSVTT